MEVTVDFLKGLLKAQSSFLVSKTLEPEEVSRTRLSGTSSTHTSTDRGQGKGSNRLPSAQSAAGAEGGVSTKPGFLLW